MSKFYYYSLDDVRTYIPSDEKNQEYDVHEINLNISNDYRILFDSDYSDGIDNLDKSQKERIRFISEHPYEMNTIAHLIRYLRKTCEYSQFDYKKKILREDIVNGKYGEYPRTFFQLEKEHFRNVQDIILYYLIKKNEGKGKSDLFQQVVSDIFSSNFYDSVVFYYDKVKKILYVSLTADGTEDERNVFHICEYFFSDVLMHVEPRWNCYPAIVGSQKNYIVSEGKQLCGSIL